MLQPCFRIDRFKGFVWVAMLLNMKDIDKPILNEPQHGWPCFQRWKPLKGVVWVAMPAISYEGDR